MEWSFVFGFLLALSNIDKLIMSTSTVTRSITSRGKFDMVQADK